MKIKTKGDIERIARGAALLKGIMEEVVSHVRVGATGNELDQIARDLIRSIGGTPAFLGYGNPPYPAALCVSVNECVVHGVPNDRPFAPGDFVKLDTGMRYDGLYSDIARMVVLSPVSDNERAFARCAHEALDLALSIVRPGIMTGDIGCAIQELVEKAGFGVIRDLAGHGIGQELHEKPELPNFGRRGSGMKLEAGMVLAFEPMIAMGSWKVTIAPDQWSVVTSDRSKTAHCEDMIAVTEEAGRILTR